MMATTYTFSSDHSIAEYYPGAKTSGMAPVTRKYLLDTLAELAKLARQSDETQIALQIEAVLAADRAHATCFVTGTLIATKRGEVAVEELAVGDRVVTASGALRPIVWLGHRDIACGAGQRELGPIRLAANAFGQDLPVRDLMLSPGHPVLIGADEHGEGGYLVPIMCLINGTTIERMPVENVTYWHIELDAHDILLAEGLPAESYLDWGDRAFFTEAAAHALANPDFVVPGLTGRCRPVAVDGPIVEAERRRLDAVFASRLARAAVWPSVQSTLLTLF